MKIRAVPLLASAALILGALAPAHADVVYSYTGPSVAIPDDTPAGVNLDINVADSYTIAQFVRVSVEFGPTAHTWVGDLIATLRHIPTGTTIDLFRRAGRISSTGGLGDSSNMFGIYTFSNVDTLTNASFPRLIDAANSVGNTGTVANGTYRPTTNTFNGDAFPTHSGETVTNLNTTFDGLNVNGTWRLNVSDNAGGDTGELVGFSFTVAGASAAVPEPGPLHLLGLTGGLAALGSLGRRIASRRRPASAG